jgi:Xaa-Pro aminopeptidase
VIEPASLGVAAIADREIDGRVERLQAEAAAHGLAAVICFGAHRDFWPADLRYLARWYCTDEELSFLFVPTEGQTTLVTNAEWDLERALAEARAGDIVYDPEPGSTLVRLVREHAGRSDRVGLSGMEVFPAPVFVALAGGCPGVSFEGVTAMAAALRLVKSENEIALLRAAARATDAGMRAGLDHVREGGSEHDVVGAAEHAIRRAGAEIAFATVMGAGPRTALATFFPSDRAIRAGDLAVLDCGARLEGYHGDMCRTITVGPPDAVQRRMLEAVAESVRTATAAARPGARVADVNAAAHEVVRAAGFGDAWWGAFMPHGTGTGQHEMPHALVDADLVLEPGMVMCIEPGIAVPGVGAVILEQMILVGEARAETLTALPLELWDA